LGTAIGVSNTAGEDLDLGDINNDGLIDAVYSLNGINKQQISLKIKPLQQLAFIVYQNKSFVQNEVKNMK
jgi:hypothetical protein